MSEQWTIENDTGAELIVRAPNGFAVELDANSADPRERFAYFAIRQQARDLDHLRADLAAAVAERDDYRDELSGLCHTLSVGSEGRPEMTAADWRKRVDQGIDFLTRPLLSRIEATDKELAKRSSMLDICTQNCSDWIGKWEAEQDRAEQAEARLAAIDSTPAVAHIANKIGPDYFPCGLTILADRKLPPLGTDLIARPAKD